MLNLPQDMLWDEDGFYRCYLVHVTTTAKKKKRTSPTPLQQQSYPQGSSEMSQVPYVAVLFLGQVLLHVGSSVFLMLCRHGLFRVI